MCVTTRGIIAEGEERGGGGRREFSFILVFLFSSPLRHQSRMKEKEGLLHILFIAAQGGNVDSTKRTRGLAMTSQHT